jgi:hypothetical protein
MANLKDDFLRGSKIFQPLLPEKQKTMIALRTGNFSFQVNQAKSVQGTRLYIDIGVHLALNKFEYQELVYSRKIFRFVPEQLSRKAKSLDSQNWTEIRYEIGTILLLDFRK